MDMYKWLWSKIGGRPWTYILRDAWATFEFFWIVGLVSFGIWLGHHYDWRQVLTGWLVYSLGYLGGHLFWCKKHIPGEKGE